jgi:Protein of unknown function (DUF2809)
MSAVKQPSQHQPKVTAGSSTAPPMTHPSRSSVRAIHLVLIAITIPLGLGSRMRGLPMPELVRTYGGDVLSATCIFFGVRYVAHKRNLFKCAAIGFIICVLIEMQQLYTGLWLVHLRDDTPLGVLLGHGFLWSDIACYAVGTAFGSAISHTAEFASAR